MEARKEIGNIAEGMAYKVKGLHFRLTPLSFSYAVLRSVHASVY